ncbi:DUF2325 domain-containing protein [Desulfonatronovibrio magnus]|uniref:DUF2325 domain-containing protein n=1 Tax=Desulfonatronovibrio magnus TaxID=698827 RepID=UPI0005EB0DBB|nr:DUF2325 domain-containing protein [Desulfonatronovibrio magnus]
MTAALIGGMDRLQPHYQKTAKKAGYKLKMFTGTENTINERIGNIDLLIIFTGKVSHSARKIALNAARAENIPVLMCHSCGVSTLKECLENKTCPYKDVNSQ